MTGEPVGLTIQSFNALSLDPQMVLLSIDGGSTSWPAIADNEFFAVNILSTRQQGHRAGVCPQRRAEVRRRVVASGRAEWGVLIAGCQAWVECRMWQTYDGGDHLIVAAPPLALDTVG